MALIIEDGNEVANANSYVSVVDAKIYMTNRGVTLPSDALIEQYLILAMDYIESKASRFQGTKTTTSQSLQWPRNDVYIDGTLLSNSTIPSELIDAETRLCLEQVNGVNILPTMEGAFIKRDKVGPIETEYSDKFGTGNVPNMTYVNDLMNILFGRSPFNGFITRV